MWTVCDLCGAVVADQDKHDQWHGITPPATEPAPDTPTDPDPIGA